MRLCRACADNVCDHEDRCTMMLADVYSEWDGQFYVRCECVVEPSMVFPVTTRKVPR